MKNSVKTGITALAFTLLLSSCDFTSPRQTKSPTDTQQTDTGKVARIAADSNIIDSAKLKADSGAK